MARPIPDMDQMQSVEVADNDSIIIDDTSAGETKRINVGDLLGLPQFGWTATGEVWTFSSWNSTTLIGVITVPSNATTKYSAGMRIQFTQVTGGTKYGVILSVSTTSITFRMLGGSTLLNETISTPFYSPLFAPYAPSTIDFGANQLAKAINTSTVAVSNTTGTTTDVTLSSFELNSGGFQLTGNGIVIPRDGQYLVSGEVRNNDTQNFFATITVNGTLRTQLSFRGATSTARGYQSATGSTLLQLSAGDVVKIRYENREFATQILYAQLSIVRQSSI